MCSPFSLEKYLPCKVTFLFACLGICARLWPVVHHLHKINFDPPSPLPANVHKALENAKGKRHGVVRARVHNLFSFILLVNMNKDEKRHIRRLCQSSR